MKSSPGFSVVIPTHNRIASLNTCLRGIAKQEYPSDQIQVIVVNDGGVEIPNALQTAWEKDLDLLIVGQKNGGPGAARNLGARYATHDWIAFTDDDCVPYEHWLAHFGNALGPHPNDIVGGETRNGLTENVYAEASQCLILFLLDYYHQRGGKRSQLSFFTSNNLALARSIFEASGGFDTTMRYAEERDLCARLASAGYCLRYVPEARVTHFRGMDFKAYWRQHQAYGSGAYQYRQNRLHAGNRLGGPEPMRFYVDMLRYPMRAAHHPVRVAGLIALAQVAYVFGFFREENRARHLRDSFSADKSL